MDHALRRSRLGRGLADLGVDALLVSALPNVRYLTGFTGSNAALLLARERAILLTDGRYGDQAAREAPDVERAITARLVADAGARASELGVDRLGFEGSLPFREHASLAGEASGVELVCLEGSVERARATKDDEELDALRRAQAATDSAFDRVLAKLAPGMTEREVAFELEAEVRSAGAAGLGFEPIVGFGEHSAEPHHRPCERAVAPGDVVKLDFGALVDGYHADMTRTIAVGEPPAELREIHALVRRAQAAAAATVRAGVAAGDVDRASRAVIEEAGHGDRYTHPLGHGVGLEIHERPILRAGSDDEVRAGAVVTLEPGVYLPGVGGVRIEDMVHVTADGAEPMPSSTRELVVL